MTILDAASKGSVFEAAKAYLASGVSILPLRGKQPALRSWVILQRHRPALSSVVHWHRTGQLSGVGVICGHISGNLVVLDLDSKEAVTEFGQTFPTLLDTFTVLSGSRRGAHFYYYVSHLPETTIAPQFELRANGAYVAAPPSPHPSGNLYVVENAREPLVLDNLALVALWVKSKRNALPVTKLPTVRPMAHSGSFTSREEYFRSRYVNAALTAQLQLLSMASVGQRNTQLYHSSVSLGQIVGAGAIQRHVVETALLKTALACGLPETESLKTIKSGIDAGELRPRNIPPAPPLPTH